MDIIAIKQFLLEYEIKSEIRESLGKSFLVVERDSMIHAFPTLDEEQAYSQVLIFIRARFDVRAQWDMKDDDYLYLGKVC